MDCGGGAGFYFSDRRHCASRCPKGAKRPLFLPCGSGLPGPGHPIHQVHQPVVVDPAMLAQADFTGAAGGDAFAAMLHRILEAAQGVGIELRGGEAFVAGETTAMDALRNHHVVAATPHQIDQRLALAQVLGAAGDVHGDRRFLRGELELVHQVGADEAHRVVQVQAHVAQVLHQAQGAGAGVAVDRVEAAAAGVEQGADQLLALVLGLFRVALGGERLAAAQAVDIVRDHHLVTGFFQQAAGLVVE